MWRGEVFAISDCLVINMAGALEQGFLDLCLGGVGAQIILDVK